MRRTRGLGMPAKAAPAVSEREELRAPGERPARGGVGRQRVGEGAGRHPPARRGTQTRPHTLALTCRGCAAAACDGGVGGGGGGLGVVPHVQARAPRRQARVEEALGDALRGIRRGGVLLHARDARLCEEGWGGRVGEVREGRGRKRLKSERKSAHPPQSPPPTHTSRDGGGVVGVAGGVLAHLNLLDALQCGGAGQGWGGVSGSRCERWLGAQNLEGRWPGQAQ